MLLQNNNVAHFIEGNGSLFRTLWAEKQIRMGTKTSLQAGEKRWHLHIRRENHNNLKAIRPQQTFGTFPLRPY